VSAWVIWAVLAIALAVGEIFTPGLFFLGPVALAAVLAGVVAVAGGGVALTLVAFIVASVASLAFLRPIARRHVRMPAISRTGTDALAGRPAVVLRRVDGVGGRVRIGGEDWSARAYMPDEVLDVGAQVQVVVIEGATALVTK